MVIKDQGKYVEQVIKDMEAGKEVEKAYYVPERVQERKFIYQEQL